MLMNGLKPPFLEVGVGSGRFAEATGIEDGVDPSPALLEKARGRGVKVKLGRGEDLPYEANSFGGVFILFTLCFLDDPEKALCEAKRVLKSGGGAHRNNQQAKHLGPALFKEKSRRPSVV